VSQASPFTHKNIRLELSATDEFDRVEEKCIINDMSELVQGFLKSLGLVLVELKRQGKFSLWTGDELSRISSNRLLKSDSLTRFFTFD
jgi:hypothetical protein